MQCVNLSAGEALERNFYTIRRRFGWRRVPLHIGHPDDPLFLGQPGHTDPTVYGQVSDLKADEEGVWIKIRPTPAGQPLLERRSYRYLSPRWAMRQLTPTRYEPIRLVSVGLTNTPQMKAKPLVLVEDPFQWYNSVANVRLKGRSQTQRLATVRDEKLSIQNFVKQVHQRMETLGESYPDAWAQVRHQSPFFEE
ncbi:MAG: phage protease [Puniceicoccales bacterium]|jgi:hypothetical protein|nr:phage protease [Puniceicoccales bacterium]